MAIPLAFQSTPEINQQYRQVEPKLIGFIKTKARRYASRGNGILDFDDLLQEGRCALMHALGSFDPERGKPLHVYLGRILDNTYRDMLHNALNPTNCPHIWRHGEDGEWQKVPHPAMSLEGASEESEDAPAHQVVDEATPDPEAAARTSESDMRAKVFVLRLHRRLNEREKAVLACIRQPDAGLLITARNLTGGYRINNIHIAAYLGITRCQVDASLHAVRKAACDILVEMSEKGDVDAQLALKEVGRG
jgi:RNA polymerase sigma factor (sigma-70 family)